MGLNIQVDYEAIYEITTQILNHNGNLEGRFQGMTAELNNVFMTWQGQTASEMEQIYHSEVEDYLVQLCRLVDENIKSLKEITGKMVELDRLFSRIFSN